MQLVVKVVVLWMCLCIHQMEWISHGARLGLVVPDTVTDGLFSSMGRVRIGEFTVNGETAELDVILEDTIGAKELWLLDFQPYRYKRVTPIDLQTGDLWSSRTGQCSSVEEDLSWDDGYFDDDYFQTRNSSGTKNLFSSYLRGIDNKTSGIRLDDILYDGDLETFMYCERSDGTNIWDFSIHFEEIQYTTVLYVTNVRPVSDWSPEGAIRVPPVAYVQTHIKLVWRLTRIAMVNFVVSSIPIISARVLEEIGRLLVTFDFAIVEPMLLDDGTPDLSRARLFMGFTTQLPAANHSMVVFKNGTEIYTPEVQGHYLEEVVSAPPSRLADTTECSLHNSRYCAQTWEFEMILRMDLSSLLEELPLDATGVFQFNFDSYKCPEFDNITACQWLSYLPAWDVSIDLTLQTTVDAVDEEMDSITLSIVKLVNDWGEDLRGGRTINHKENITVEVNFSPAFLRSSYTLELQLFMICIGDQHMDSSRGCLGASEDKRYSAFVGDELNFNFDPTQDPEYQASLPASETPPSDISQGGAGTEVPAVTAPQTYTLEKLRTREYGVWTGVVADSVFVRPYDSTLIFSIGYPRLYLNFLMEESIDASSSPLYIIERFPPPGSSSRQPTILADDQVFQEYFAPHLDQYHILDTVFVPAEGSLSSNLKMMYSAFTRDPEGLSYVGYEDPVTLPCERFDSEGHYVFDYETNWINLLSDACQFLTELAKLKQLIRDSHSDNGESTVNLFASEPQVTSNQSVSQDTSFLTERDRLLAVLHLEPSFVDKLEDFGSISNWEKVNTLLYTALLFQEEDVMLAFEPSGDLNTIRDKVRFFADEASSFNSLVLESVEQQGDGSHVELSQRLKTISDLTPDTSGEGSFSSESSASVNDDFWLSLDIDESFYFFLWSISIRGTGSYHGNIYKTESQNPLVVLEPNICFGSYYLAGYLEHCQVDWVEVMSFMVYKSPFIFTQEVLPGGWGFWSEWGECSQSCDGGVRSRHRECLDDQAGCEGQTNEGETCSLHDCSRFDKDGFLLIFKATEGIGTSIYDYWVSSTYTSDEEIHPEIFKSVLVEQWADTISVEEVKVALLIRGRPVLELVFDGRDTDKMNWFSYHRLISSPYEDIDENRKNFFSIEGHGNVGRRFYISSWYDGCSHQDGWMVILDGGSHSQACMWERQRSYPKFLYSKVNTMTNFQGGQVGIADEFAVYLKYVDSAYVPPPPTLPPPILYTSDSIAHPVAGNELLLNEYDMEKYVHRSQLQNNVLSQERNLYTMTAIYTLVSTDEKRQKRDGHRFRRTLLASAQVPQLQSAHFTSEGCPSDSEFNPIDLACECLTVDWFYSKESFQCEPRYNPVQDVAVTETNVNPAEGRASAVPCSTCLLVVISVMNLSLNSFSLL